jgi:hypothetical protein
MVNGANHRAGQLGETGPPRPLYTIHSTFSSWMGGSLDLFLVA